MEPVPEINVPGCAKVQMGEPLVFVKDPGAHSRQVAAPGKAKFPGKHFRHASEVIEFILIFAEPAGHSKHSVCLVNSLYVPTEQNIHSLLPFSYVPIGHGLQLADPCKDV